MLRVRRAAWAEAFDAPQAAGHFLYCHLDAQQGGPSADNTSVAADAAAAVAAIADGGATVYVLVRCGVRRARRRRRAGEAATRWQRVAMSKRRDIYEAGTSACRACRRMSGITRRSRAPRARRQRCAAAQHAGSQRH
eukprot:359702-Chlamydomonas_euryale.AAC.10